MSVFSIDMVCEVLDPWSIGKSEEEIDSKIKTYLKESYGSGKMKTVKKGSDVFMENYTLHCSTKDMNLTKENTEKVIKALKEMKNKKLATNDNSSFEITIKESKKLTDSELLWQYCNLVNNDKLVENIGDVHKKENKFVKYIKETHKLLKENNFPALSKYLKENREQIIKLNNKDKVHIKLPANFLKEEFIDKLDKILDFMCIANEIGENSLKSKELNGIKKETFMEVLAL